MNASSHPPNQLLQLLDAPDFDLLRPRLATVKMVRKSVLEGAALRCDMSTFHMVDQFPLGWARSKSAICRRW
ncbi:hypothetical protein [Bradyrhizobium sp. WSM1743]|uniref:hypothetical protein n=1 Tax=Bradyrhizobium sp. WSM1743 TaxID=318996 RepID=UPI000489D544|nr:hypothetical protein [Bradyrhizobium sp. WSM1743]